MADGDEHGGDAVAGAEDEPDSLASVAEIDSGAGLGRGVGVLAHEAALGDAYRGEVEEEAEVAGDAEAARVGEAVAVDEEEVGGPPQLLEGAGEDGDLAEGEEAGDVGEGDGLLDDVPLDQREVGVGEEGDGGNCGVASTALTLESDVAASDEPRFAGPALGDDLGRESNLDLLGLGDGDAPGVELAESGGL